MESGFPSHDDVVVAIASLVVITASGAGTGWANIRHGRAVIRQRMAGISSRFQHYWGSALSDVGTDMGCRPAVCIHAATRTFVDTARDCVGCSAVCAAASGEERPEPRQRSNQASGQLN